MSNVPNLAISNMGRAAVAAGGIHTRRRVGTAASEQNKRVWHVGAHVGQTCLGDSKSAGMLDDVCTVSIVVTCAVVTTCSDSDRFSLHVCTPRS